jgi:hypothetical protein
MGDLPDYTKKIVLVVDIADFPAEVKTDHRKIKGVALKDPTVEEAIPISVENDALAYDAANDRFKVDVEKLSDTADIATQTTLAALNDKVPTDPATESGKLTDINTALGNIKTDVDKIPSDPATESGKLTDINTALGNIKTHTDYIPSDPATESGKLTNINTALGNIKTHTDYIPSDPATESGKLTDINTALGNIKTDVDKIPTDPAKESGKLTNIDTTLTAIKSTDGIKKIADDVNVKTSGGTNIIIDKLTQEAYTELRRTISNHGTTPSWTVVAGSYREGKFFPRGCRGFLNIIDIYCKDAGSSGGTITVYLAPNPDSASVYNADVTVPAGGAAAWRSATFNKWWKYDSLFIFVVCSSVSIQYSWDESAHFDDYMSSDSGATWTLGSYRVWFNAVMAGQTVGDVTVSGAILTVT